MSIASNLNNAGIINYGELLVLDGALTTTEISWNAATGYVLTALFTAGNPYIGAGLCVSTVVINKAVHFAASYLESDESIGTELPLGPRHVSNYIHDNLMGNYAIRTAKYALSAFLAYGAMTAMGYVIPLATVAAVFIPAVFSTSVVAVAVLFVSHSFGNGGVLRDMLSQM